MNYLFVRISLALILFICLSPCANARTFQKGMAFYADKPFDSQYSVQSLTNLRATGADWVCIVFSWWQDTINSTYIYPVEGMTPSISALTSVINNATKLGFKVFLKPHVDVLDGVWRAWIGTYFTEDDWDIWFYSYKAYYLNYALLAQQLGVAMYSVGVEMITASAHSSEFIDLVHDVRQYYHGIVTYSANWGSRYQVTQNTRSSFPDSWGGEIDNINWINVLDIIGIDAYYYLTTELNPSVQSLVNDWTPIANHIHNISQYWNNKSVVFTEIGYRSIDGAAIHPAWWNITGTVNVTQQAICYEAVFQSLANQPWWEGVHWWSWSSNPQAGGMNDTDFTPQNKPPTLSVLQKYYSIIDAM